MAKPSADDSGHSIIDYSEQNLSITSIARQGMIMHTMSEPLKILKTKINDSTRHLNLSCTGMNNHGFSALLETLNTQGQNIEYLSLERTNVFEYDPTTTNCQHFFSPLFYTIRTESIKAFTKFIQSATKLGYLNLSYVVGLDAPVLSTLSLSLMKCPSLTFLSLGGKSLYNNYGDALHTVIPYPRYIYAGTTIDLEGLKALGQLVASHPSLEYLDLHSNDLAGNLKLVLSVSVAKESFLRELNLSFCRVDGLDIMFLARFIEHNPNIRMLDIHETRPHLQISTGSTEKEAIRSIFEELKVLVESLKTNTKVSMVVSLTQLENCPELEQLFDARKWGAGFLNTLVGRYIARDVSNIITEYLSQEEINTMLSTSNISPDYPGQCYHQRARDNSNSIPSLFVYTIHEVAEEYITLMGDAEVIDIHS